MRFVRFLYLSNLRLLAVVIIASQFSCDNSADKPSPPLETFTITIDPSITHQEMIGFGGALTWYSTWLTGNANKEQIYDLIFSDLGIDIVRFKTWYYPDGYPSVTSTTVMTDDNSKIHYDATNELFEAVKTRNPDVKILLSSWGPPAALKSNNSSREGTLKKDANGNFMYDDYANYWEHTLDHLPFNPDYISIQNEPTYTNPGWTTCKWSSTETLDLPDYHIAFDNVYDKIKERMNPPILIGPESPDITSYASFANILNDKAHCGVLAFHPYNVNALSSPEQIVSALQGVGNFATKPNIMTEFSDNLDWFNTALFIQNCLIHAQSSGYIYWKLVWATPAGGNQNAATVSVSNSSPTFTVTPFYHVIKHFAKYVDAGHRRVEVTTTKANLIVSAFKNPDESKLTVVMVNTGGAVQIDFSVTGQTLNGIQAYQSKTGAFYSAMENITSDAPLALPAQSITTAVLDLL